ncbi:MAG: glycine cleavage system protein H [Planctomycetes bacterium]|nr:glycine cleavage system protein H [Planctomycetota bacterium]
MSDDLVFMMGEFEAIIPTDRQYAKNHMWAMTSPEGGYRFGFTAYAVRLLQDVYFLEWSVDAGVTLAEKQEMGAIESKKAESALYSPISGYLPRFNDDLLSDPSTINVDKYGDGWLFEIEGSSNGLLSAADYIKHLEAVWEVTQRTIKGQLN